MTNMIEYQATVDGRIVATVFKSDKRCHSRKPWTLAWAGTRGIERFKTKARAVEVCNDMFNWGKEPVWTRISVKEIA